MPPRKRSGQQRRLSMSLDYKMHRDGPSVPHQATEQRILEEVQRLLGPKYFNLRLVIHDEPVPDGEHDVFYVQGEPIGYGPHPCHPHTPGDDAA